MLFLILYLNLSHRVEQSVYAVLRTRDMAVARYKEFGVPTQWMLDSGLVGKVNCVLLLLYSNLLKYYVQMQRLKNSANGFISVASYPSQCWALSTKLCTLGELVWLY